MVFIVGIKKKGDFIFMLIVGEKDYLISHYGENGVVKKVKEDNLVQMEFSIHQDNVVEWLKGEPEALLRLFEFSKNTNSTFGDLQKGSMSIANDPKNSLESLEMERNRLINELNSNRNTISQVTWILGKLKVVEYYIEQKRKENNESK